MRHLLILTCIFISQSIAANETLWTELDTSYQFRTAQTSDGKSHIARRMQLDFEGLKQSLITSSKGTKNTLKLPNAKGELINFQMVPTSVMSSALADRYPDIKTWKITSTDKPEITGRIDIGPLGFHGLFHTSDGDRIFIDPQYQEGSPQTEIYTVLSSRANHGSADADFTCELHGESSHTNLASRVLENPSDDIRTYRLALSTTGEYTQLFGGTKAYALAGVTKTVNRLNQVFERDLNIRLELIAENDKLIFTSPSADPYNNYDAADMAEENIVSTNSLIGSNNYDIGHVFGTGRTGGLAFLNSTCGLNKAGGVTGSDSPDGEAFTIDYVAHEIGHQLGASHTFNGNQKSCSADSRVQKSAVEPGSGSSIMSYAGICGDDDLQANSNAFFHSTSIAQIRSFTQTAAGAKCGTLTATINNNPDVNAGQNHTIPAQTPFVLTGNTIDIDGDVLLHSWEQSDRGASSDLYSDLTDNPLFRIWNPTTSSTRYFPRLSDLLSNKSTIGELLPTTDRQLNFSLLVRDNNGGLATDDVTIKVIATSTPFAITSDAIPPTLTVRQSFNLTWDVADTNKAPINCQSVNIGFIKSNANYLSVLRNSPNDGSETVTLPLDIDSISNANIKVACSDNIFFAVSTTNHSVIGGKPVLSINPPLLVKDINGRNVLSYTLKLSVIATEEIFIHFQATPTANTGEIFLGKAVIVKGENITTIKIPVAETTIEAAVKATQLIIEKPDNAQFEVEGSQLVVQAAEIEANPEPIADVAAAIGGGSFGPFLSLALFLLVLARLSSMNYASTLIKTLMETPLEKNLSTLVAPCIRRCRLCCWYLFFTDFNRTYWTVDRRNGHG